MYVYYVVVFIVKGSVGGEQVKIGLRLRVYVVKFCIFS